MSTTGAPMNLPLMADSDRTPYSVYNAAMAILNGGAGASAWTAWVPTWTNLTVGNGVVVAKYMQIGKFVIARFSFVYGSSSAVSGDVTFSLPVTRAAFAGTAGLLPLGLAGLFDTSASLAVEGHVISTSTTQARVRVFVVAATLLTSPVLSATVPFTWATGDEISVQFSYEAA